MTRKEFKETLVKNGLVIEGTNKVRPDITIDDLASVFNTAIDKVHSDFVAGLIEGSLGEELGSRLTIGDVGEIGAFMMKSKIDD